MVSILVIVIVVDALMVVVVVVIFTYFLNQIIWLDGKSRLDTKTLRRRAPRLGGLLCTRLFQRTDLEHFPDVIHDAHTIFGVVEESFHVFTDPLAWLSVIRYFSLLNGCPPRVMFGIMGRNRTVRCLKVVNGLCFLPLQCSIV